ncbi:hypothetical protein DFH07DRAFT_807582 [Mycena maculata]|uniref:DUF4097 domain-containing protein n=1 Tax=Mycena maculata TaxID=230809 RepID=A0AAD7JP21_9AGAR|nr:hypothetical protein DFH07DRAFT_807582 [Mycena maculata]
MIITENTPPSPVKASTPLLGGADGSGSGTTQPAYAPPTSGAVRAPYFVNQPSYGQQRESSAARRFCFAFLFAIGIWLLVSTLLGSIFRVSVHNSNHAAPSVEAAGRWDYPIPPDVSTSDCVAWSEEETRNPRSGSFPYYAAVSLDVPLPYETLLLLSAGSLSNGNLKITTSPEVSDIARVDIAVHYYTKDVRDLVKICYVDRKDGESGVGIFTPRFWRSPSRTDRLYFEVVLTLPQSTSPLFINRLVTDVSNFSHDLDALEDIIKFGEVFLTGSNGKIHAKTVGATNVKLTTSNGAVLVDHLVALNAAVRTSNAGISGNYSAVDSLHLTTSNGAIKVEAALTGDDTKPLILRTSNHVLEATINLGAPSGSGGSFHVQAETSNGRLAAHIASAPVEFVLTLQARTSNAKALVKLPPTYEGDLEVHTSNAGVGIARADPHEEDPRGEGRTRRLETRVVGKYMAAGAVYWDRGNVHRGGAVLRTSNGAATIYV